MNRVLSTIAAVALLAVAPASATAADVSSTPPQQAGRSPIRVFVLAGQSNIEGAAVVDLSGDDYNGGRGTLATLLQDPAQAAIFAHLRDADGAWARRGEDYPHPGHGHHEFGNAETYLLVGDAAAQGMLQLLAK